MSGYPGTDEPRVTGHPPNPAEEDVLCLNESEHCEGRVEFHSIDPGRTRAFPRCEFHWLARLEERENSMERYATSDIAPDWLDPADIGERWDEDY